jgi:hypothetical protein
MSSKGFAQRRQRKWPTEVTSFREAEEAAPFEQDCKLLRPPREPFGNLTSKRE